MNIATAQSGAAFGSLGIVAVWDDRGNIEAVPLPDTVNTLASGPDFPTWKRGNFSRTYILGGHTDNLVFTEHKWALRVGINAPSAPWVTPGPPIENQVGVVAAGASGLSGQASFAFRFLDSLHFRRSPLGASSPAITLANQGATFSNVPASPIPVDPCVDKIEIYVSIDGGLYRHWATRDIGAPTFTVTETATGEAYIDELSLYPKLSFACMANDRMVSSGDPRHPERVYFSQVGNPEEYAGLWIPTRNGEPVIALKNINGSVIYVQCPTSSYYIQGFGEGDLVMRPLKPTIGGFGQRTIAMFDDVALIPTQRGWYRCNGTSMDPIGVGQWDDTWRKSVSKRTVANHPSAASFYQNGFVVVDLVTGVVKFYVDGVFPEIVGFPAGLTQNASWVIDFSGLVPEVGGSGNADLSFDIKNGAIPTCAAMMYNPNEKIGKLYTADATGWIYVENEDGRVDRDGEIEVAKQMLIHSSHKILGPAPDPSDASQVTDAWLNFMSEDLPATFGIYAGNEFAWQSGERNGDSNFKAPEEFTIPAGRDRPADTATLNYYVPRDKWLAPKLAKSSGSCVSVRMTINQTTDYQGSVINTEEQRSKVVFYGWGAIAQDGSERRPLARNLGE